MPVFTLLCALSVYICFKWVHVTKNDHSSEGKKIFLMKSPSVFLFFFFSTLQDARVTEVQMLWSHNAGNAQIDGGNASLRCEINVYAPFRPCVSDSNARCGFVEAIMIYESHKREWSKCSQNLEERSNNADCHMKGNRGFINLSLQVCTFLIFSIVYSHPSMAAKVDKECIVETRLFCFFQSDFLMFSCNILISWVANWVIEFPPQERRTKGWLRTEQKEKMVLEVNDCVDIEMNHMPPPKFNIK